MHAPSSGIFLLAAALLPAQRTPTTVVEGAAGVFARALATAAASTARAGAPTRGRALAMHVLACLRLGDLAASSGALAAGAAALDGQFGGHLDGQLGGQFDGQFGGALGGAPDRPPDGPPDRAPDRVADAALDDNAWLLVAHLWHVRASGDFELPRARWRTLRAAAERAAAAPPPPSFAAAAMRVHAMFCFGALADARDRCAHPERWRDGAPRSRPGNAWTERAIGAQIELERDLWLPGRCCFRAAAPAPAIADAPPVADAATLLPASAGLLVATGDRLPQHLTHTLDALERAHTTGAEAAALCLATATQLVDDDARERSWTRLLAALDGDRDGTSAGLVLDALLYAVTGVRNATGAGVDEGWLRCAPWLPPGHEHLAVRGVCADGCRLDLELTARSGPARADEADRSAHFGGDGPRLHVRVVLVQSRDEKARPVIVAGATVQTVQWLQPGESFACSLPRVQTQPQHDARAIDGRSPECGEEVRRR